MSEQTKTLKQLQEEVRLTQRLVIQAASNNEETSIEEWSFIEKKLYIIFGHIAAHFQHQTNVELTPSEQTALKSIHQYYIEMVSLIKTRKQEVSEELRLISGRDRVHSTYSA